MIALRAAAAAILFLLAGAAQAADIKIAGLEAQAYLEQSGKFSPNLIGGAPIVDAPRGGAFGRDTATGLLVTFTFDGPKNATPKYATATVDLVQTGFGGRRVVTHKAFTGFIFGPDGVERKALFLDEAMCMRLEIDVHAGHTHKTARLDLSCAERQAAQ